MYGSLLLNFFILVRQPPVGQGLLIHEVSRSHTTTHHIRQNPSGRMISSSQRPLPNNTHHSQQTVIHATGGIRTHNLSRLAAADLHHRPRGHWERLAKIYAGSITLEQHYRILSAMWQMRVVTIVHGVTNCSQTKHQQSEITDHLNLVLKFVAN
jgi:hypothetical protein